MGVLRQGVYAAVLAILAGVSSAVADSVTRQTDWMELVKGYKGSSVGAEVRDVEQGPTFGSQTLTIAIPKSAIPSPEAMEEVRVVGKRPEEFDFEFPLKFTYEWLDDYDNDYYGLVIHLGEYPNKMPVRLYMESRTGFIR